jgi:hypothetical protein
MEVIAPQGGDRDVHKKPGAAYLMTRTAGTAPGQAVRPCRPRTAALFALADRLREAGAPCGHGSDGCVLASVVTAIAGGAARTMLAALRAGQRDREPRAGGAAPQREDAPRPSLAAAGLRRNRPCRLENNPPLSRAPVSADCRPTR